MVIRMSPSFIGSAGEYSILEIQNVPDGCANFDRTDKQMKLDGLYSNDARERSTFFFKKKNWLYL